MRATGCITFHLKKYIKVGISFYHLSFFLFPFFIILHLVNLVHKPWVLSAIIITTTWPSTTTNNKHSSKLNNRHTISIASNNIITVSIFIKCEFILHWANNHPLHQHHPPYRTQKHLAIPLKDLGKFEHNWNLLEISMMIMNSVLYNVPQRSWNIVIVFNNVCHLSLHQALPPPCPLHPL